MRREDFEFPAPCSAAPAYFRQLNKRITEAEQRAIP